MMIINNEKAGHQGGGGLDMENTLQTWAKILG